jgi:Holliday junction resolvase-like predicted endonuclease
MPRKDLYHDVVKHALERDGWRVTRENQALVIGEARVFIDLSAELIVAERDKIKIAVEVKSFLEPSSGRFGAIPFVSVFSTAARPRKTVDTGSANTG